MNLITSIIVMAAIGAFLGASTNHLAIKMLFRPYNPIFIGKWQVPFTPGLIPKRRDQLAISLGETVTKYLLTPETFRKKFFSPEVRQAVLSFSQTKVEKEIFKNDKTIQDWLNLAGYSHLPQVIEGKVDEVIAKQFENIQNVLSTKTLDELIPAQIHSVIDQKIPEVVADILSKGEDYFKSEEGEVVINNMMNDFLASKGSFGGMIQMFLGDSKSIVDKLQRELIKFLQAPGTTQLLVTILEKEWVKLKQRPAMEFLTQVEFEPIVANVQTYVKKEMAITERLDQPISHYWPDGNRWAREEMIPKLIDKGFVQAEMKLADVLERLNLKEVVREQVDSFPVQELENLVLGISKRELKMITYLGGVIGGLIGIVQGLLVFFTN